MKSKYKIKLILVLFLLSALTMKSNAQDKIYRFKSNGNPIIRHKFTADPATLIVDDTLWLYTGHDITEHQNGYNMKNWSVFSTTDMINWTEYPLPLKISDFVWEKTGTTNASAIIKRNGKYYWYMSSNGSGIGVAVSNRPQGPFKDALGKPLLKDWDCGNTTQSGVCLNPSVFIDDDDQAWLFWGSKSCYYVKLRENMTELDGSVKKLDFDGFRFSEAPRIHKYKAKYYLTYATGYPEKVAYAMADKIEGPYEYKGLLFEVARNSNTNHISITEFKGQSYFFYHNGGLEETGGNYSRSVCAEFMQYNTDGSIKKIEMSSEGADRGYTPFDNKNNPVIEGYYADPEVMYSNKTRKYYIYPTSDGFHGWSGDYFKAYSSANLKDWKDEGVILNLKTDVSWAKKFAWAPCIIEKKINQKYKYYYYYTADKKIGVAVSNNPIGPFKDSGKPLIDYKLMGQKGGQQIDPDVFTDPKTGKDYLYWGCGYMAVAELNEDMLTIKKETAKMITPPHFTEGTYVFHRKEKYYFLWSENDTRSEDYRVRYGFSDNPMGPITIPENNLILSKNPLKGIYGTGHNSILQIPGKDEWYIVYHRFRRPNAIKMGWAAGYHREVCIDKLEFNEDGSIKPVTPTL